MRYIPPFPLRFVQRKMYINLLLKDWVSDMVIRGCTKVGDLCDTDLETTLHCTAPLSNF
jgi:hypothetical protein